MSQSSDSILRDPASIASSSVVVLFVIVVVLAVIVVVHHVLTERHRHLSRLRFESAALALAPHLVSPSSNLEREVPAARLRCGDRAVALVLRKIRYDLKGELADRASAILDEIGEISRLLHEARSRRDWRRLGAIRALGECGGARARKALIHAAAHDRSDDVRGAAREGLLHDGSADAVRVAVESFVKAPPQRDGARHTFYIRLASASEEQMTALMRSGRLTLSEQKLALEAMGDVGRRSALTLARDHFLGPDAEMRATATRVVGKVGGEGEIKMAIHALDDEEWYVRAAAARALECLLNIRPIANAAQRQTALERLQRRLADPAWWVRANAARALAHASEEGRELLRRGTASGDAYARDAAVAALGMLGELPASVVAPTADPDEDLTIGEQTFRPGGLRA